jgi:hypothetical protein
MVLLPKTVEASSMKDYHTISLIHMVGKLFSKVLANRLAPKLDTVVHPSHGAFIQGCLIHDNFCFEQGLTKLLHAQRVPSLLLKVDIVRAFDSVAWPFLLEILAHLQFPNVWINWVSTLLATSSTKVLMNGALGDRICHAHGLWQAESLSPMMFLLVMEVLGALIRQADSWLLFKPLGPRAITHWASIYIDDLIIFLNPVSQDIHLFRSILDIYVGAFVLTCNMSKCQLAAIRCDEEQTQLTTPLFLC